MRRAACGLPALLALLLGAGGCGDPADDAARQGGPRAPERPFVRDCRSRVEGRLPVHWRRLSVVAGPLAFYPARLLARYPETGPTARLKVEKVLAVAEAGTRATVVIPASERRRAALAYDQSRWPRYGRASGPRLSECQRAVRFEACAAGQRSLADKADQVGGTQFNGGFIVRWPGCVTLEVFVEGRVTPLRPRIRFGTHRCRADQGPF